MIKISSKKYFYKDKTVYNYCKTNELMYQNVTMSIRYYNKKTNKDLNEIIDRVIIKYLKLKEIKRIKRVFIYIKNSSKLNLTYISKELNLNYNALKRIESFKFTKEQSIKILWFLSDKKDKEGKLAISTKQIKKICKILRTKEVIKIDDLFIICFINIGYEDYYNLFLEKRKKYMTKLIFRYLNLFNLNKDLFFDVYQELLLKQMEIFHKNCSRNIPQIMKYYNLYLKGYLIELLKNLKKEKTNLSLFSIKYDDVTYLETISNEYL